MELSQFSSYWRHITSTVWNFGLSNFKYWSQHGILGIHQYNTTSYEGRQHSTSLPGWNTIFSAIWVDLDRGNFNLSTRYFQCFYIIFWMFLHGICLCFYMTWYFSMVLNGISYFSTWYFLIFLHSIFLLPHGTVCISLCFYVHTVVCFHIPNGIFLCVCMVFICVPTWYSIFYVFTLYFSNISPCTLLCFHVIYFPFFNIVSYCVSTWNLFNVSRFYKY